MKRPNRNIRAVISYQVPPKLFTNWTYSAMTESTVHAQVTKVIRKQASSTSCHLSWCRMHSLPCALGRHIHLLQVRFNWPVYVPLRSAASCGGSGPPPTSNTWFVGHTWVSPPTASQSVQLFWHSSSMWQTCRQTHTQTMLPVISVVTGRIYALCAGNVAKRPSLATITAKYAC